MTDTERLDWMDKALLRRASLRLNDTLQFIEVNAWSIASAGTDLRAAVDAAIAAGMGAASKPEET